MGGGLNLCNCNFKIGMMVGEENRNELITKFNKIEEKFKFKENIKKLLITQKCFRKLRIRKEIIKNSKNRECLLTRSSTKNREAYKYNPNWEKYFKKNIIVN